jgi:hypothetical protein
MTLPASKGGWKPEPAVDALPIVSPPRSDPSAALTAALKADLSPKAYRLITAVILACPEREWLSNDQMAAAAGFTSHQARPLAAELVRAGLLTRRRTVVRVNGEPKDVLRYLPVVPA